MCMMMKVFNGLTNVHDLSMCSCVQTYSKAEGDSSSQIPMEKREKK